MTSEPRKAAEHPIASSAAMRGVLTAVALALLLAAGAAQAQTSVRLVSNTGQAPTGGAGFSQDYRQAFTTGDNADGYRLTYVELEMRSTALTPLDYTVTSTPALGMVSNPRIVTGEPNILELTVATAANATQAVTVAIDSASGIQDAAGTDSPAVVLSDTVKLTYNQRLLPRFPPPSAFTVTVYPPPTTAPTVTGLALTPGESSSTVVLTLSTPVKRTDPGVSELQQGQEHEALPPERGGHPGELVHQPASHPPEMHHERHRGERGAQ